MTLKALIESDVDTVFFNTDDFAEECTYTHGQDTLAAKVIRQKTWSTRQSGAEQFRHIRAEVLVAQASELIIENERFLPAAGDKIEFPAGTPILTVFPLENERPYLFVDGVATTLQIFAVYEESLQLLIYHSPTGQDVPYTNAIAGAMSQRQEDGQAFGSVGGLQVAERVRMRVVANHGEIVESGTCTVLGGEWAIEEIPLAVEGLIELQLRRQPIKRHPEARRR
jgi:hypothetical protein